MCGNLCVIIKQNFKIVFRQGAYAAIIFLFLIPNLYGIANLNSEKAADCLGKLVVLIGIPLFVPIIRSEQDSAVGDVVKIKAFPRHITVFLRIVLASLLSVVLIYCFTLYVRYHGCQFPIYTYTMRTAVISILIGGVGILGSALSESTLSGFLVSSGFAFLFHDKFVSMIFEGIIK